MNPTVSALGQPIPRVESRDKVTGRAIYSADVAPANALWAKNVRSPFPHARIVSIDTSRALQVPGVRLALTGKDVPPKNQGRRVKDLPLLARDRVRYVGDKVAVVAAESAEAAEEGALLVEVEYDELPFVLDPILTMQPGAPIIHPDARSYAGFPENLPADAQNVCAYRVWERGDLDAGFREADLVIEHTFRTQLLHQSYLEPHASAVAIGADGRVDVWVSNKVPYSLRAELASLIDRPEPDVRVNAVTVGGDFGSKGSLADTPLAFHIAQSTGRPVKFVLGSHEDLTAVSPRHPSVVTLRSGVMRDGRIVARDARVVYNTGAYGSFKPGDGMLGGAGSAGGPYEIPHLHIEGLCVYTNQVPCGYMRAPGQPQVVFAVEAHMDLLARELGMDPIEFRHRNALRESSSGGESVIPRLLREVSEAIGWSAPRSRLVGRGVAVAERGTGAGEGSSDVTVNPDGSVRVISGIPDNGAGGPTVIAQVVSDALGVPFERVRLERRDTDALPIDAGSGGSRLTNTAGHAALAACDQLKAQLAPLAARMLGTDSVEWTTIGAEGRWRARDGRTASLAEVASEMIKPGDPLAHAQVTVAAPRTGDRGYCIQAAEVEVDPETGQVQLRKMASVQDVGRIVNPLGHQGQIEGAVVQGVGYALSEELIVEDGRIVNGHLGDYKIPTMQDLPQLITVNVPFGSGYGPLDVKGIGELPIVPTAGAIANAVADAIGAPIFELPITAERVLAAIDERRSAH